MSFAGLRVLSLESRRAKEMEAMIRRLDGDAFVAPSVQERALEDHTDAIRFVERLESGDFDLVVCMTGAGLAFLRDVVQAQMPLERLAVALRKVTIISRGPKPVPLLRAMVSEVSTLALSCTVALLDFCETAATDRRRSIETISVSDLARSMGNSFHSAASQGRLRLKIQSAGIIAGRERRGCKVDVEV